MKCYLIIDHADCYELPVGLFDNVEDVARYLDVAYQSAKNAIATHSLVHRRYEILRISY